MAAMNAVKNWLKMWNWRIQERTSERLPERWHERTCPFCRGMNRYLGEQAKIRAAAI